MRHRLLFRGGMAVGLAVSASLATLAFSGPASASTATCTKLAVSGSTATISGCNDLANTGGKGTFPTASLIPPGGSATITWNTVPAGTTTVSLTVTAVGNSGQPKDETETKKCPAGAQEYSAVGKVTSDTGKGSSITVGGKVSMEACLTSIGAVIIEPGSKIII